MKVRALPKFEGIKDIERNVFPKAGDEWEVSEERANFLKEHGVIEIVDEIVEKHEALLDLNENKEGVIPLNELSIELTHDNNLENTTKTTYNPNIPITNGLAVNTKYKSTKKSKKSKK